ncbi:M16 family metallopeptidase [Desulfolutivibrio sulfoxidireducens]|uniref:M16 family metallopeptidase n=1 Tax=Desulfolutivibrio sulfoxidireducens TaxID=2773299 RepID=UPI00159E69FA|nr:pitrilysin family protein [Desulfolutivibrio sulfoxidireducens]QLA20610.1 insulinase family protein [Desulfolutivibrio sulfoxidireducens]
MLRKMMLAVMLVVVLAGVAVAGSDASVPRVYVLKNGMTVAVLEDERFPLASVRLYVHAGSAYETPEQSGISHLLEHMVFKSTETRGAGQAAKDIESAGGAVNAATSFDYTMYYADLPADRWLVGLEVIKDMIFGARFEPSELESEKKVVLAEIDRGRDDPQDVMFQDLQALMWPGTGYERPIIGSRERVAGFSREDLKAHVARWYQPQSMLLVVAGKVDAGEVLHKAEALFGDMKNDRTIIPPMPLVRTAGARPEVKVEFGEWNKVYLSVAFPTPGMRAPREAALEIFAQLLGGDETSRLYRRFKYEKRLVDEISASSMTLERGGILYIGATLDAANLETFWKELLDDLAGLKAEDFTDREIERAKLNLEDALFRARETIPGLAAKFGSFVFFGYGTGGEANYLRAAGQVDRKELQGVIDAWLKPGDLRAVALLPRDAQGKVSAEALEKAVAAVWPAGAGAAKTDLAGTKAGGTEIVDLGGGHRLVLSPDQALPYAAVSMVFAGGDMLLAPDEQGLAQLASDALIMGTTKRGAVEIQDFLSDRAASLSAASGRDTFSVEARYPSRFAADLLGLFAEVLREPAFAEKEVERTRQSQLAGIKRQEDEPMGLAFRKLFPFLYSGGGYSYTRLGDPARVAAFTPDDARRFMARQMRMPWVLSVCGEFDRAKVVELATSLAAWCGPAEPYAFATPEWGKKREEKLTLAERNQSHLLLVFPVPGTNAPQTPGLELLNTVLAGQGGLLFKDLREKESLGYSVTSFLWQSVHTGFMAFYIGTEPQKAERAMEGFKRVAAGLAAADLPEAEVSRAKNLLWGDYHRERQRLGARSNEAARELVYGYGLDHDREVIEKAVTLSAKDLRDLAGKYLDPGKAYVMRIEP